MTEVFHLVGAIGQLFCVVWRPPPAQPIQFGVLCVPPFGEECNKSRRMLAEQARALSASGGMVLLVDLTGTGDSESDFRDATFDCWQHDLDVAWAWLGAQIPHPLWIWGIRLGGLLAAHQCKRLHPNPFGLLLWQPIISGKTFVSQFLRLALIRQISGGSNESGQASIRTALTEGRFAEVGGYQLNPELMLPIEALKLDALVPTCRRVIWLECSAGENTAISPVSQRCLGRWQQGGCVPYIERIVGTAFWANQEIEMCEILLSRTTSLVLNDHPDYN